MSNLPNPNQFKEHTPVYSVPQGKITNKPSYDIKQIDKTFREALLKCESKHFNGLVGELFNGAFWNSCPNLNGGVGRFGYSPKDKSLTIHLNDENKKVQTIVIRKSGETKWKTYGSKRFIPHDIHDEFIFIYSGMAETIICERLGLSYIGLQSDGMVKHLPVNLKELARDKNIIVLADNDKTFKAIIPTIREFFSHSKTIVIDFEVVLKRELPHGYDFRDFVNEIGNADRVLTLLEENIIKGGSNV